MSPFLPRAAGVFQGDLQEIHLQHLDQPRHTMEHRLPSSVHRCPRLSLKHQNNTLKAQYPALLQLSTLVVSKSNYWNIDKVIFNR